MSIEAELHLFLLRSNKGSKGAAEKGIKVMHYCALSRAMPPPTETEKTEKVKKSADYLGESNSE